MSRNLHSLTKWMPIEINQFDTIFLDCKLLEENTLNLLQRIGILLKHFKNGRNSKNHFNSALENETQIQDIEDICTSIESITDKFNVTFQKLKITKQPLIIAQKIKMYRHKLWLIKLKISYYIQDFVNEIAHFFIHYGEHILVLTLRISVAYNEMLNMDNKYELSSDASVCNNTCPYLMFPLRRISVTRLLQILAMNRAEICCHKLIDCLLETYKMYEQNDDDSGSDNSSLEIYMALTKHMQAAPTDIQTNNTKQNKNDPKFDDTSSFLNLEELIEYEEKNVLDLLDITMKTAPVMLGNDGIKKSKNTGIKKISTKARNKVLEYYEEILWGEVGNYLEHIVLWWAASPLSARPPHSSQHLREWINQFIPTADVPAVILSALASLADALGVHVTSTSWDKLFRVALVATKTTCNPETGKLFGNVLQDLVTLSNQCEVTPDWILGAPLDELPLVEQIPVLHRLDHSVHTTRLWAINESRKIANTWNVEAFFAVTQNDIVNCVYQLNSLRLADHTPAIEKGGLGVHVEVCALMRAKLASEVGVNIQKLKDSPNECVDGLAAICRTISLANLKMIFPQPSYWKQNVSETPHVASSYVGKYLDQILLPVLLATSDPLITNMILKLMCESWLDHIYNNKIKFSRYGAVQLLCDFDQITVWLNECTSINQAVRKKLMKNEILRRCEGVGRLLLHNPGDKIAMMDKLTKRRVSNVQKSPGEQEKKELMPAEMYVPNQEQWLELRAMKKRYLFNPTLCCGNKS